MLKAEERIISIKDFVHSSNKDLGIGYKDFWKESNIDKNVFLPHEQLMTIERRIIYSAYRIGMGNMNEPHKTPELAGEVLKYHISGEASVQDSIKGLATDHKRQKACRILKAIGNMGSHPGDPGAAARYTSVRGTPLLSAIIKDMKYVPFISDQTGVSQPQFVSTPIPMVLINGLSNIGTGHSAYYDERLAREVIDWIEKITGDEPNAKIPDPMSSTGCKVWKNPTNGYTYYEAVSHREGKFDVFTNLPPKRTTKTIIGKIQSKIGKRADKIEDASEEGRPIWIKVPRNLVKIEDYTKYGLITARKETPYIWDTELDTMRMSSHSEIAKSWYDKRIEILGKRINFRVDEIDEAIRQIELTVRFYNEGMQQMSHDKIIEILGDSDADIVLSKTAKSYLKENIEKSIKRKEALLREREELLQKNLRELLFFEARDIIVKQEEYFDSF